MSPPPNQLPQPSESSQEQNVEPMVRRPNPPPIADKPVVADQPVVSDSNNVASNNLTANTVAANNLAANTVVANNVSEETPPIQEEDKRRHQPIPPPSEPMQYRAIGLVRGKYVASEEQFTRGMLVATDGHAIDAVLLGRVMSLVKNHLDLETEHLWVVYPRTRQQDNNLHVQIVGVWEPENLDKSSQPSEEPTTDEPTVSTPEPKNLESEAPSVEDGYFSIRGEVVYQAQDQPIIIVKIKQTPRNDQETPKFFKLTLTGSLEKKAVGRFWDFQIQRQAEALVIQQAEDIGMLRPRKPMKPRFNKQGRPGGGGGGRPYKKQDRPSRPTGARPTTDRPTTDRPTTDRPTTDRPTPRPVKRQQQSGEESKK